MTDRPTRRWLPVAATVALAVLLIAAIVILPYPGKTAQTTEATTATSVTTTSTTSLQTNSTTLTTSDYNSSLGLDLTMGIARGTLSENDGVALYFSLNNTLATQNNLTRPAGSNLPSSSYETCSQLPVGAAIFRGNYDVGNASQGEPLGLISPNEEVVNGCPGFPNSWSLAPMSNDLSDGGFPAAANMTFWGYWAYDAGDVFRPFSPGIYTVEGIDLWGQATILHFQVVENQDPLDCATIASNSSFVAYTNGSAGPGPLKLDAYYRSPRVDNTVVLALTNTGNSTLTGLPYTDEFYFFSPNMSQADTWGYYAPNGTMGYPAFFYPGQCVLVSATSPPAPLTLVFSDNQTQTFNQGPGYVATIPSMQVHPNSTVYVMVSVPSGMVTVVTSNEGSSAVTTMTTSATTIKNGG
jgi:hypothetical protein